MTQTETETVFDSMRPVPVDQPAGHIVSVVVPCYNTARYLDECLSSLSEQTYPAIEVIAIDDGSTDDTAELLDDWGARDSRITVVHQDNRGLGAARNVGIDRATGAYLTFVDSDDLLPLDALERMVSMIERTGSDFVSGVAERFDDHHRWRAALYRRGFREDLERTHVYDRPSLLNDHIVCSKLFRRAFWHKHGFRFPEGTLFEDIEIATRAHCLARSVDLLSQPTYRWRSRPEGDASITQDRTRPGAAAQRFDALARADRYVRDHAPPNVWRRHGLKVVSIDIPLYLHLVDDADDRYVREFVEAAGAFLGDASPDAIAEQGILRRRLVDMLIARDVDGVRAMAKLMGPRATRTVRSRMAGVRQLDWRDRLWLVGVAPRALWIRTRRALTSRRAPVS